MAQAMVNFRMDETLKEKMEKTGGTIHEVNLDD